MWGLVSSVDVGRRVIVFGCVWNFEMGSFSFSVYFFWMEVIFRYREYFWVFYLKFVFGGLAGLWFFVLRK